MLLNCDVKREYLIQFAFKRSPKIQCTEKRARSLEKLYDQILLLPCYATHSPSLLSFFNLKASKFLRSEIAGVGILGFRAY